MKHILSIILILLMAGVAQAAYVDCSGMPKSHTVMVDINLASDGSSIVSGGATTERAGTSDSNYYYNFTNEVAGTTYSIECVDATNSIYTFAYTLSGRDTYNDASVAAVKAKTDNLPTDPADDSDIDTQLVAIQADLDNPNQYKADVSGLSTLTAQQVWEYATRELTISPLLDTDARLDYLDSSIFAIPTNPLLDDDERLDNLNALIARQMTVITDHARPTPTTTEFEISIREYNPDDFPIVKDLTGYSLMFRQSGSNNNYVVRRISTSIENNDEGSYSWIVTFDDPWIEAPSNGDVCFVVSFPQDIGLLAKDSTVAKEATLTNATYGLSALQVLLDAIATSTELQAMFDEIKGAGWTTETLKAIYDLGGGGGGGGLTAQQVRDAMQLAPTTDSPATGSVDKKLDNIERHN